MTELETITRDDTLEELLAPLVYRSAILKRDVIVPVGFSTDLASVPRVPLAYMLAGGTAKKAAVVHDYLYTERLCSRAEADAVLEEAMTASGQPWWRIKLMWAGVRLGGGSHWESKVEDETPEQPMPGG